ncbi:Uncharacterised protein [Mycobacteroides abscessus subsp. abscessus]|nr:Uncharacterised protein [Mycobacteroides abscessus subsp. abscessus]
MRTQTEVLGDALVVGLNLVARGKHPRPVGITEEGVLVDHRRDIHRDSRVYIVPPGTPQVRRPVDDDEVFDPRLFETHTGAQASDPRADHDDVVVGN